MRRGVDKILNLCNTVRLFKFYLCHKGLSREVKTSKVQMFQVVILGRSLKYDVETRHTHHKMVIGVVPALYTE